MQISTLPFRGNFTDTVVKDFTSLDELAAIITGGNYAPGIFKGNYTNNDNFLCTHLMVLDFDNYPTDPQLPLSAAIDKFSGYKCIIATTRNHNKAKLVGSETMPAADRFRVILFLSEPIVSTGDYYATWQALADKFPGCDDKCKDPARRLYQSDAVVLKQEQGLLVDPVRAPKKQGTQRPAVTLAPGERGRLSRRTQDFMKNGAPAGSWNSRLYVAAKDHQEQGYTQEEFEAAAEQITGHLDHRDMTTIRSAFRAPPKYAPRVHNTKNMSNVEQWARKWFEDNSVGLSYKDSGIVYNGERVAFNYMLSRMVLDAKCWAENNPIKDDKENEKTRNPYGRESLEHSFTVWEKEQLDEVMSFYRHRLAYDETVGAGPLKQWVKAVTGDDSTLDYIIMRHFIWQIKRKLHGQAAEWHIMPILFGPSGGGKSVAVKRLLGPIDELTNYPQAMTVLDDSREAHIFGKFYAVFFDEMAKIEKVDVNALKNKITSDSISYRRLGTNTQIVTPNVSTFIGASNKPVQDIIYDPTSARRFWEIRSLPKLDHAAINSVDYDALWKSVSHEEPCPVIAHLDAISHIQETELKAKTLVELWLDERMDRNTGPWWQAKALHTLFLNWAEAQNIQVSITSAKFGRELQTLGVERRRTNSGTMYRMQERAPEQSGPVDMVRDN